MAPNASNSNNLEQLVLKGFTVFLVSLLSGMAACRLIAPMGCTVLLYFVTANSFHCHMAVEGWVSLDLAFFTGISACNPSHDQTYLHTTLQKRIKCYNLVHVMQ